MDINILNSHITIEEYESYDFVIDALFGFSFEGPSREPFSSIINTMSKSQKPVLSVDIPSGWNVNQGDIYKSDFYPSAVISLTVPKLCMVNYKGIHYVGGRFVSILSLLLYDFIIIIIIIFKDSSPPR